MGTSPQPIRHFLLKLFLSYFHIRDFKTYSWTCFGHFWNMSLYDDSRAIWVLLRHVPLRKSMKKWWLPQFWFSFRNAGMWAMSWANLIGHVLYLEGCCGPSNIRVPLLATFCKGYRVPSNHLWDQRPVHGCSLCYFAWSNFDFWKYHCCAIKYPLFKWQIYSIKIYSHLYFEFWDLNYHKGVIIYSLGEGLLVFENFDNCLSYGQFSN